MWQQSLRGAFWSTGSQMCMKVLQMVIFIFLARLVEPYHFGVVAFAALFFFLLQALLCGGIVLVLVRSRELDPVHTASIFWVQAGIGVALTVGIALAAWAGMRLAGPSDMLRAFLGLSPAALLYALSGVPYALLLRSMRFKQIAFSSLLSLSAGGSAAVLLAWAGFGLQSLIVQQLVYAAVTLFFYARFADWTPSLRFSPSLIRGDLPFALGSWGDLFVRYWSTSVDRLLVASLFGPVALGFYELAQRVCTNTFTVFVSTISSVSLPVFSQLQSDLPRIRRALLTATPLAYFVAIPISVLLIAFAPELITLVFGERWLPAAAIVRVLALLGFVYPATLFFNPLILAFGKPSWNLFLSLFVLIATVTGMLLVGFDVATVAWVTVIVNALAAAPAFLLTQRLTRIAALPYLRSLAPMGAACAAMTIAILLTRPASGTFSPSLLLSAATGGCVYLVVALLLQHRTFRSLLDVFS